jgi:hypothetical protein
MCLRLLRAEIWSQDLAKKLNRFTACMVPDTVLQTPAVLIHGRLLVLGGDNQRIHEEIIVAGGLIREGRFSRMNVGEVRNALAAATAERPPGLIEDRLKELWPKIEAPLIQALEARMTERAKNLQKFLDERSEREVANVTAVMREMQYLRDLNRSGAPRLTPDMIELPSYWQSITPVLPHGATGQRRPAALRICRRTF